MFTFRAEPEGSSHVFPQPASTTLNIVYGLNEQANVSIYIYNAAGTPVAQLQDAGVASDYNKVTLDLSGFSPGVYFYIIKAQASGREIKFNLNKFMVAK